MIIEVNSELTTDDIKEHIERMEKYESMRVDIFFRQKAKHIPSPCSIARKCP